MTDTITKNSKGEYSIQVSVMKYTNGDTYFVYCPSLDLYGYGSTLSKANKSFEIVLSEYMRYTTENETLDADLKEHGWHKNEKMSELEKALIEAETGQVTRYESFADFKSAMERLVNNSLYDTESGEYINEETMQAIRDVENGESYLCKSFDEIMDRLNANYDFNSESTRNFEKSIKEFENMVKQGLAEKRGYNLRTIEDSNFPIFRFNTENGISD